MMRPAMSAPEPAVSGTISRIARVGYSCARALVDRTPKSRAAAIRTSARMTTSRSLTWIWQSQWDYAKSRQALYFDSRRSGGSAMKQIVLALLLLISLLLIANDA